MAVSKTKHTAILRKSSKAGAGKQGSSLTREQLADDLKSFRKAGGKIEVLGNTNTFKRIS